MTTQALSNRRIQRDASPAGHVGAVAPGDPARHDAPSDVPALDAHILERAAKVIRVLGHPLRLRLLEVLETGEHHVTDLVTASGATQALVSQHLAILRAEGVVGARRDGLRVFYRITEPKVHSILACIRECDMPETHDGAAWAVFGLTREV